MKTADLIRLAVKNLKGEWAVLPCLGLAIGMFCLCFAGAVWQTVGQEKSQPYELAVSASGRFGLTDGTVAQIVKLPNVTAATPLLPVPARVKTGIYAAQLTLIGVDPAYLRAAYAKGGGFPSGSAMPYIVLNAAACRQFSKTQNTDTQTGNATSQAGNNVSSDAGTGTGTQSNAGSKATATGSGTGSAAGAQTDTGSDAAGAGSGVGTGTNTSSAADAKTQTGTGAGTAVLNNTANSGPDTGADSGAGSGDGANADAPQIDWLNVSFSLQANGSGQWIPSKVCGVTAGSARGQPAAAYISLATAKSLLVQSGRSANYTGAKVRVTNSGYAASVSRAISVLGLQVTNPNAALQTKWDSESKEMTYLIVLGAFCLLCSAALIAAWREMSLQAQKEAWEMLRWLGIQEKNIRALFLIQVTIISWIGILAGVVVALALPAFLPSDLKGSSIYTLSVPFADILLNGMVCTAAALASGFAASHRHVRDHEGRKMI